MRASHYAQALAELVREHPTTDHSGLVKQFVATVQKNGHANLFPRIVKSFAQIEKKQQALRTIEVISATSLSAHEIDHALKMGGFEKAEHQVVTTRVDDTLIGGTIVRTHATRIDSSWKRELLALYMRMSS